MKTFNQQPDNLMLLVVRLSIFFLLSLIIMNNMRVDARPKIPGKENGSVNELRQKVREIYTSQIGIREKHSNAGPAVEQYLRYVNLPKGNPWCAAFVCWVYGKAGVENPRSGWSPDLFGEGRVIWGRGEQGAKNKEQRLRPGVRTVYGSSLTTKNQQQTTGVSALSAQCPTLAGVGGGFRNYENPTTGDIFGLYFPEKGRIAHVGFIDRWDGTWLITVEGNTNEAGSREGDGVYRKRRLTSSVYKVARYIGLFPD